MQSSAKPSTPNISLLSLPDANDANDAEKEDLLADYRPTHILPPSPDEAALQHLLSSMENDDENMEIPESKPRRILELRLQQHFIERTSYTFSACNSVKVRNAWANDVPKLALANDNVLYGMFALSALHLLKSEPDNKELLLARQTYVGFALREHRRAIALLNSETADAVCYASTLALADAFACLQDRPLNPWTPPMQWITMARGSGSVFGAAFDKINNFQIAKIMPVVEAEPNLRDGNVLFADSNQRGLEHLLGKDLPSELLDDETRQAYERVVNYIGGVQIAIMAGEHKLQICRRIMAFALLGPKRFHSFVQEQRPRALVILAHFFALAAQLTDVWWMGNVAEREIQGIQRVLPAEWQGLMRIALKSVGLPVAS